MLRWRGHHVYPGNVSESVCISELATTAASTAAVLTVLPEGMGYASKCLMSDIKGCFAEMSGLKQDLCQYVVWHCDNWTLVEALC